MIDPDQTDIGRRVVYRPHPSAPPEEGVVTSYNDALVFVRYGADLGAKATRREDLRWVHPTRRDHELAHDRATRQRRLMSHALTWDSDGDFCRVCGWEP